MFTSRRKDTQKQKAYEYYNSYKWEKVTWPTFYQRVRLWWDEPWEERIKVKIKRQYNKKIAVPKWKWAKEMVWYLEQPEPKATKSLFRNRLYCGYAKEDAILIWEEWMEIRKDRQDKNPTLRQRQYIPKKTKVVEGCNWDPDVYRIDITYPKEVAKVFRKEYQKLISDTEDALMDTEDALLKLELTTKLEQLQAEVTLFNNYNK